MRASQEFSEREAWVSTTRAHLKPLPHPRKKRSGFLPLMLQAGTVVTIVAVAAKYLLEFAKMKGWM